MKLSKVEASRMCWRGAKISGYYTETTAGVVKTSTTD
jgi:hypothetical protein